MIDIFVEMANQPLLIHPDSARCLYQLHDQLSRGRIDADKFRMFFDTPDEDQSKPGSNIAVIPVHGALTHRNWWGTSYMNISRMLDSAMNDSAIEHIVFDIRSPGGEVSGIFDLTEKIYKAGKKKNTVARVSDYAFSGGYAIASACKEIVASQTSEVGSVGVVSRHMNYKGLFKKEGISIEFLYAGRKKVDGNPFEPLSDSARTDMQQKIESVYEMFVSSVAKYRKLEKEEVIETQAGTFIAGKALEIGFITKIESHEQTFERLMSRGKSKSTFNMENEETPMPTENVNDQQNTAPTEIILPPSGTVTPDTSVDALAVVTACNAAGMPEMAEGFLKSKVSMDEVRTGLEAAKQIMDTGKLLGVSNFARPMAVSGVDLETARARLTALAATVSGGDIDNSLAPDAMEQTPVKAGNWDAAFKHIPKNFVKQK